MKILDDVKEMGMYDLAHNQFFVKDREAWYRDFEREISCRDLVREICKKHDIDLDGGESNNDEFEDVLFDWMQYGTDTIYGVIAMYYTAMWAMANIRESLKLKVVIAKE